MHLQRAPPAAGQSIPQRPIDCTWMWRRDGAAEVSTGIYVKGEVKGEDDEHPNI